MGAPYYHNKGDIQVRIIDPYIIIDPEEFNPRKVKLIERFGRVCYKSEHKMNQSQGDEFVAALKDAGHDSVLEHEKVSVIIVCDRGVSHEIVRHRIASYSQESTRYCNYSKDKFNNEITVIRPFFLEGEQCFDARADWRTSCERAELAYFTILKLGHSPQVARSVLPTSLKTEIVVTYNMREWRHFFKVRARHNTHPQMQQIAIPLLRVFMEKLPAMFNTIVWKTTVPEKWWAEVREESVVC